MKFTIVALAAATAVSAQVVYENGTFKCLGDAAGKNFCAGNSLETNIIIRCTGEVGQPGNCNDNLAGVPPIGVKTFAPCYQTSETAGDAACSFNGIAYPDSGESFPIPGYGSSSSSSSAEPTTSSSSSSVSEPVYPTETSTSTSTSEPVYPTSSLPTEYPTSTLVTVTGTVTVTSSCSTTSKTYVPTGTGGPAPPSNTTTYTTGLPIPTQIPSGAGALLAKDGIILGALAIVGFLFL
ncbi:hypothetical protein ABW19_dt0200671 [Dactylella cylindrospora]|nr:hypothetical protein ABW19_dt0200671 [Dactylella cylindrospora]